MNYWTQMNCKIIILLIPIHIRFTTNAFTLKCILLKRNHIKHMKTITNICIEFISFISNILA